MASLPPDLFQWLFTPSALYHTPSRADGHTLHQERVERARGVEFLFRVGLQLGMHQHAMAAAAVYFHRFYMRYSFVDYHRFEIAATCLFLAGKVEENGRKLHDVACAVIIKLHKSANAAQTTSELIKEHAREVTRFEHLITVYELHVCDALCFDLEIAHAQGVLVIALDSLLAPEDVADLAWTVGNDALYTPLCILHPPNIIACACYLLALALLRQPEGRTLDAQLADGPDADRWKEVFELHSPADVRGVRDSIAIIIEFWAALDADTRRQFNTKLEDVPAHIAPLAPPSGARNLAAFAPPEASPLTNGHAANGNGNGSGSANGNGKAWGGGGSTPWRGEEGSGAATPWSTDGGGGGAKTSPLVQPGTGTGASHSPRRTSGGHTHTRDRSEDDEWRWHHGGDGGGGGGGGGGDGAGRENTSPRTPPSA